MKKSTVTLLAAVAMVNSCSVFALHKYHGQQGGNAPLATPSYSYTHIAPVNGMHFQGPMWNSPNWDGLFDGSHLAIWARAAYFRFDYNDARNSVGATGTTRPDWKQAAVGGMLDWLSGYAGGWFGINASLYGAQKLESTGPGPTTWLVRANNAGEFQDNYGRVGRLNAKFRFGDEVNNVLIHAGYVGADPEYMTSTLLSPEAHKLTYSSERGATLKSNLDNLQLYGAYWDRFADRTENGYGRFNNGAGENIDNIYMGGATYTIPFESIGGADHHLKLNAEYAEGKDFLREYFGQFTYRLPFNEHSNMVTNGQYYYVKRAGNLWDNDGPTGRNLFDDNAQLGNINLTFNIDRFSIGAAFSHTEASSSTGTGIGSNHFYYSPAGNYEASGFFGTSRQASDFDFHRENAYQLGVGYDFSDFAPGLSASITHTYGNNMVRRVGIKSERETDLAILYKIPGIQGMWIDIEDAYYHSNASDATRQGQEFNDFRIWLNYQVALF